MKASCRCVETLGCSLRTGEPHNGEEKGVAPWESREKGDKTVGGQRERPVQTGREESSIPGRL